MEKVSSMQHLTLCVPACAALVGFDLQALSFGFGVSVDDGGVLDSSADCAVFSETFSPGRFDKRHHSSVELDALKNTRHRSHSPHGRSHSPRDRSRSPHGRSRSPHGRSRSPRDRSRSPRDRSRLPRDRSRSPRDRSRSPLYKDAVARSAEIVKKCETCNLRIFREDYKTHIEHCSPSWSPSDTPPRIELGSVMLSPHSIGCSPRKESSEMRSPVSFRRETVRSPSPKMEPRSRYTSPRVDPESRSSSPQIAARSRSTSPRVDARSGSTSPRVDPESRSTSPQIAARSRSTSPRVDARSRPTSLQIAARSGSTSPRVDSGSRSTSPCMEISIKPPSPKVFTDLDNCASTSKKTDEAERQLSLLALRSYGDNNFKASCNCGVPMPQWAPHDDIDDLPAPLLVTPLGTAVQCARCQIAMVREDYRSHVQECYGVRTASQNFPVVRQVRKGTRAAESYRMPFVADPTGSGEVWSSRNASVHSLRPTSASHMTHPQRTVPSSSQHENEHYQAGRDLAMRFIAQGGNSSEIFKVPNAPVPRATRSRTFPRNI